MEEKILNQTERITEYFAEKTEGNELRTYKGTENQKNRERIYKKRERIIRRRRRRGERE